MTRDEAIEIEFKSALGWSHPEMSRERILAAASQTIDGYVKLGMLTLDEAPLVSRSSPEYKLYDAVFEYVPTLDFMPFKKLIDEAGLKIVEK